ncbi:hypothetical protein [Novosphingobium sp.]|uniref:hypothetical protein n=1 Tax=Novosphingobium sp. TaxID=1874826 RepID=UPI00286E20DE|nr:hypothetical protein [Novosphingobium sp.]
MKRTALTALLLTFAASQPAHAEMLAPVMTTVYPAMSKVAAAPVNELRFDYAAEVHLFNVQMVKIYGEHRQSFTLFAADGAYLRGKTFVFPLQQPLTRDGIYRIQVMAQSIDNGPSHSTTYEFTIGEPEPAAE